MKKKIILILSMCALLVCLFIMSASATNAFYLSDSFDFSSGGLSSFSSYIVNASESHSCNCPNYDFILFTDYNDSYFLTNVEAFQEFSYSGDYASMVANFQECYDNSGCSVCYGYTQIPENVYVYFLNYNTTGSDITEEDLVKEYNKGKIAGYNEGFNDGKESGYTEGYSAGYVDNAREFSDSFTNYTEGAENPSLSGYSEYINSGNAPSPDFETAFSESGLRASLEHYSENYSSSSSSSSSHGGSSVTVTEKGDNYGASHEGDISTDCCYNPGYVDGIADGGTIYKGSDSYQTDITNEINSYMQSEEYETLMNVYSQEIVTNYLKSEEYRSAIDSSFVAGQDAGEADAWEKAKNEVLAQGVRQGYLNYKDSQEYKDAIDSSKTAGYIDGVEDGKNSVVDPSGVLILFAIVIFLGIIIFAIHKKARSKKRR